METVQLSDVSDPSSDILAVALDNVTFEVVDENYEIILESPEIAPPPEHPGNGLAEGVHHPVPLDNVVDIAVNLPLTSRQTKLLLQSCRLNT